jgi:decaprenylphospho-beta-D-ribofuranose 2-oxidase
MTATEPVQQTRRTMTGFGRIRPSQSVVVGPAGPQRLQSIIVTRPPAGLIARGAGLSYGDAAQNAGGIVVAPVTGPAIELDAARQTVTASSGTTFAQILHRIVPAGFILPVLPGTSQLTLGGAIAADVHGKNHRQAGSLSAWIDQVEIVDGTGELRQLSSSTDPAGLRATVGGMGLTGIILAATIRLRRIESDLMAVNSHRGNSLDGVLSLMEGTDSQYCVAWIDATASGAQLGRGIVDTADHAGPLQPADRRPGTRHTDGSASPELLSYRPGRPRHAPAMPVSLVTPATARAFNSLWFRKSPADRSSLTDLASFFHRLDAIEGWNRVVGPDGLIQYQFVVPVGAEHVLSSVLEAVQHNNCAPFLGTLKRFGVSSGGPLSFPVPGWCLAIDMPAGRPSLGTMLTCLDMDIANAGGRIYLAKDARVSGYAFDSMYGKLDDWRATRARLDPHGIFRSDLGRRVGLC